MAYTYTKLANITIGSVSSPNIVFIGIPQNYTDLLLVTSLRTDRSATEDGLYMVFNWTDGNVGIDLEANGSSASSVNTASSYGGNWATRINGGTSTSNAFSVNHIYIPNYTNSLPKTWSADGVMENNATTSYLDFSTHLATAVTTPVNSIYMAANASFVQNSSATLYGIRAEA